MLRNEMEQLQFVEIEWTGGEEFIHRWNECNECNEFHATARAPDTQSVWQTNMTRTWRTLRERSTSTPRALIVTCAESQRPQPFDATTKLDSALRIGSRPRRRKSSRPQQR